MNRCRPLEKKELLKIINVLKCPRDRCFFIMGLKTGFRVSELLSLKVSDVYQFGQVTDTVTVQAKNMKGGIKGRTVPLHQDAKNAVLELLGSGEVNIDHFLFKSRHGENQSIKRGQAYVILKNAANALGLTGFIGTHSMRKTFARDVYDKLGKSIFKTQKALGHKNITSTISYMEVDQDEIDAAFLK